MNRAAEHGCIFKSYRTKPRSMTLIKKFGAFANDRPSFYKIFCLYCPFAGAVIFIAWAKPELAGCARLYFYQLEDWTSVRGYWKSAREWVGCRAGGQIIKATVEFVSPDGMIVQTHEQTWDGFPQSGNPGTLRSPGRTSEIIFQFPWTQAQKSTEGWEIRARVEGAALELDLSDNVASVGNITMDLPNLVVNSLNISSSSGNNLYLPSSVLSVTGAVRNSSDTRTQEGVFFPLVARLYRGQNTTGANFVESETLILPSATPGGLTVIGANADATYEIKNLHLPDDAAPGETFTVAVTIDPSNVGFEDIVFETNENDNSISQTFTSTDNANTRARLSVSQESFEGDVGPFNGLDPVRMAFTVRNIGLLPVQGTGNDLDSFTLRVVLSKDITFDNQDFILREFDFSGNALGAGLLPNESVTLDWIQQLPDNFEGDFYYLVNIQGDNQTTVDFPLELSLIHI